MCSPISEQDNHKNPSLAQGCRAGMSVGNPCATLAHELSHFNDIGDAGDDGGYMALWKLETGH